MGSHSLLQGIIPTQGLSLGLLHCRQLLSEPLGKPEITQFLKDGVRLLNLGFPFPNPTFRFHMLPLGREIADEFGSGLDNQSDACKFEKSLV